MKHLVLVLLATFWMWETFRYLLERYAANIFAATRPIHPFLVAFVPGYLLWPRWVAALGVAGAVGILVGLVDRYLAPPPVPNYVPVRRSLRDGLPPLP